MKVILSLIFLLALSFSTYAKKDKKVDMKDFSKALNKNITERIDQNPQDYETRPIRRAPASVGAVEVAPESIEPEEEDLDQYRNQAVGHDQL